MLFVQHVNKIDDDDAADVAQAQLSRDGKGSFKAIAVNSVLNAYGANAKQTIEEIKADPKLLGWLSGGRWSKGWNAAVKAVESGKGAKPMISFEEAKKGKLAK